MNQQHRHGGPHGLASQVHGGMVTNRMVGALQSGIHRQQPVGNTAPEGEIFQGMADHGGGKIAGIMPAHAIDDGPEALTITADQRVFIGRPTACVGTSLPPPAAHVIALAATARHPAPDTATGATWRPETGRYGTPATTGRKLLAVMENQTRHDTCRQAQAHGHFPQGAEHKGNGDQHHANGRERHEQFLPETEHIVRRFQALAFQVAGIFQQFDQRQIVRLEHHNTEQLRRQLCLPLP